MDEGYSVQGVEIIKVHPNSKNSYAKTHLNSNSNLIEHFVKCSNGGSLFHPWSHENKMEKHRGKYTFEYTRVIKDVFDSYVRFLETKNIAHLKRAERNM